MTDTLSDVLDALMIRMGEDGPHLKARLLISATRCMRELSIDATVGVSTKHVRLPLDANRAVPLPDDWLATNGVALQVGNTLYPLAPDDTIAPFSAELMRDLPHPAALPPLFDTAADEDGPAMQVRYTDEYWGRPGTYTVDVRERVVRFGPSIPSTGYALLVYQASPPLCEEMPVDAWMRSAVEDYCLWQHYQRKQNLSMAREHERQYKNGRQTYLDRIAPSTSPAALERAVSSSLRSLWYPAGYVPPYPLPING